MQVLLFQSVQQQYPGILTFQDRMKLSQSQKEALALSWPSANRNPLITEHQKQQQNRSQKALRAFLMLSKKRKTQRQRAHLLDKAIRRTVLSSAVWVTILRQHRKNSFSLNKISCIDG